MLEMDQILRNSRGNRLSEVNVTIPLPASINFFLMVSDIKKSYLMKGLKGQPHVLVLSHLFAFLSSKSSIFDLYQINYFTNPICMDCISHPMLVT